MTKTFEEDEKLLQRVLFGSLTVIRNTITPITTITAKSYLRSFVYNLKTEFVYMIYKIILEFLPCYRHSCHWEEYAYNSKREHNFDSRCCGD